MQMVVEQLMGSLFMVLFFAAIPFVWWLIWYRKQTPFWQWLGFYMPKLQKKWWVLLLFAVLYYFFYAFDITRFFDAASIQTLQQSESVAANAFAGLGTAAILPALIQNFIGNGVAEELFFRGFLCKRLMGRLGDTWGIVIQAVCFGLMHNILYLLSGIPVSITVHIFVFVFTGIAGLLLGYLNEKIFNGSIYPSILLHGLGNFISTMLIAFGTA